MSQFQTQEPFSATPMATLLYEGYSVSRRRADEWYHVTGLPVGSKGSEALAVLPPSGTHHDVADNAIVVDHQYVESINERQQIWWVKYRVPVFGGAPRDGSRTVSYNRSINIPTYALKEGVAYSQFEENQIENVPTSIQVRAVTRQLAVPESVVATATATRINKATTIDGIPYQYLGYSAREQTGSLLTVTYQFSQDAAIPAIPAGTMPGSDVSIPAKPILATYFRVPGASPGIVVRTYAQLFGTFNFSELP